MSVISLGTISLGVAIPTVTEDLAIWVPFLTSQQSALNVALSAGITPPSVGVNVNLNTSVAIAANLTAALSAGFTPPDLSASIQAQLTAMAALQADMQLMATLEGILTASVAFYSYSGASSSFGSTIGAATSGGIYGGIGPTDPIDALILFADASTSGGAALTALFAGASGGILLGAVLPTLDAAIALVSADFAAQLSASAAMVGELTVALSSPQLSFAAALSALASFETQFTTAMAFAIAPPSVDINATLEAQLGIVTPALSAFVSFKGYLSASVAAYAYSGPANGLGAAITSVELSSGTTAGIVVATDSPATWATIGQLFKTS